MTYDYLKPEDYDEPRCLLLNPQTGKPECSKAVPLDRVCEKLDSYCAVRDFESAEKLLLFWLGEATLAGDMKSELGIRNEMVGFYRKQDDEEKAFESIKESKRLISMLEMEDSVTAGTCYVNCGTAFSNFGYPQKALSDFEQAQKIYEKNLPESDKRLGGLYNNMALALCDLKRFGEAYRMNVRALEVMEKNEGCEPERAITYLNMADAVAMEHGLTKAETKINQYLEKVRELLDSDSIPQNGYFAYVLERCVPAFYCYGLPEYAEELTKRSENIFRKIEGTK